MTTGGEGVDQEPGSPQEMEQMLERVYHLLEIRKRILWGAEEGMEEKQPQEVGEPPTVPQVPMQASPPPSSAAPLPEKRPQRHRKWGDILFYGVLLVVVVVVLVWKGNATSSVRTFAGFSAFTVLSGSMETEIPKGSLILVRQVDPNTLQVGENITYMRDAETTITHRIVEIVEDYQQSGQRAFRTQGIMNSEPDKQLVPAVNVVGKVVFHSYVLGQIVDAISQYWHLVVLFFMLFGGLYAALRAWIWRDSQRR